MIVSTYQGIDIEHIRGGFALTGSMTLLTAGSIPTLRFALAELTTKFKSDWEWDNVIDCDKLMDIIKSIYSDIQDSGVGNACAMWGISYQTARLIGEQTHLQGGE